MSLAPGIALAERGLVPTPLLRGAMRRLCADRLLEAEASEGLDSGAWRTIASRRRAANGGYPR